ncbi:MAG: hypothetical protein AAGF67_02305 [Verrucomicrobiota bacterium]
MNVMEPIRVDYVAPTKRAFEGMKNILFRPFDIQKWFILGFSAWLACLGEGGGSSGGNGSSDFSSDDSLGGDDSVGDLVAEGANWLEENIALVTIIGAIVLGLILVIGAVVLWLQSRGKFMFFDNVVHNRTRISEPWKEFREVANSLFWWKLVFNIATVLAFVILICGTLFLLWPSISAETFDMNTVPFLIGAGALLFILYLAVSYIHVLLENFVIPVMHRDRLPVNSAWKRILRLHQQRFGSFVTFFLWMILISIGTAIAVFALVIGTCCIALIPLIIPYLGTVLLLPLYVFLRLIGPEFLKQFGSEFDTLETAEKPPLPLN